jgi:DNA mismatch endonuclease, patch repair protein
VDKISGERRSYNMSRIRAADTRIELTLRRALWAEGARGYRVHPKNTPGRPDITFRRWRIAVFVDGCFWHACEECFVAPSSNKGYWGPKIARNVERDELVNQALLEDGWRVVRIWEHEIERDLPSAVRAVTDALDQAGWRPPR